MRLVEVQQTQSRELQEALQEATDRVQDISKEAIQYRQSATEVRHEKYALQFQIQRLEERLAMLER